MAQDEQLHVLGRRRTAKPHQPVQKPDEDQVQQAQRHGTRSLPDLHSASITAGHKRGPILEPDRLPGAVLLTEEEMPRL
ncbi:hypothetical protein AB0H34_24165 [Saccharopolyspora shandongensis]|uniref:hypothetical protein n=1 Tax=Saccharopolyspora shandongensis TaxID=418495 RepID=UPI003401F093